jgi:aspartate ammonia-lyase
MGDDGRDGVVTALNPHIGYAAGARIAKRALARGRTIPALVVEEKLLSQRRVAELLRPESFIERAEFAPTKEGLA